MKNKIKHTDISEFEIYKKKIVEEDVETLEQQYNLHWYEWIPIIGAFIYLLRMSIVLSGINRGSLRKNITKYHIYFIFGTIFIWHYLTLVFGWCLYIIIKKGIVATKKELENGKY